MDLDKYNAAIRKAETRGEWNGWKVGLELGCVLGMAAMAGLFLALLRLS